MTPSGLKELARAEENAVVDDHHARLGEYAALLWKHHTMTDIKVIVDGVVFPSHKAVLTCYSPYFNRRLLQGNRKMTSAFELTGVSPQAFEVLLRYMYTGELEMCCRSIADVYKTARKLEMKEAIEKCSEVLSGDKRDMESLLSQYVTAREMGLSDVHAKALARLLEKFEEVVLTREFLHLTLHELQEIIMQDTIGARSEIVVFLAALKWLNYDYREREPWTLDVMRCVRFPLMEPEEVLHCHYPPLLPQIMDNHELRDTLLKSVCFSVARMCGIENCFKQYGCAPRKYLGQGDPLILWDISRYDVSYRSTSELNLAASKIQAQVRGYLVRQKHQENLARRERAAATIQAFWKGYVVRKLVHKYRAYPQLPPEETSKMDSYSCDPWLHILLYHPSQSSNNRRRKIFEMVNHFPMREVPKGSGPILLPSTNVLLATGGINPTCPDDEYAVGQMVLRYNPEVNIWQRFGTMPVPRHHHCTVFLDGDVYVIGGCDPRVTFRCRLVATNDVFKLNVLTGQWSMVSPMLEPKVYHGAAVINGVIYVVGGKDECGRLLSTVECYDKENDRWWELDRPLCCPRMAAGITVHKGLLWVAGGFVQPHGEERIYAVRDVECYDPISNKWLFTCTRIPVAKVFGRLVSCGDTLLLVGGCGRRKNSENSERGRSVSSKPSPSQSSLLGLTLASVPDVLVYDNDTNHWLSTGLDIDARHDVAVASSDNMAYYVGGLATGKTRALNEVICHQTHLSGWSPCQPLPLPCTGIGLVSLPPLRNIKP